MAMNDAASQPVVVFLPGMQGPMLSDRWFVRGLKRGGLRSALVFDWTGSRWWLRNLRDRDIHRRGAERLARWIARRRDKRPDRPIVLIGHSTGAMVIVDTLGRGAGGPAVAQAWLLAAAISSDYDLREALGGVGRLVNMHSAGDWLVLGAGTRLFGTADGQYQHSAGLSGFTGPGCDDRRLEQIAYDPKWLKSGHLGGHLSALSLLFACDVLAPMILDRLKPTGDAATSLPPTTWRHDK